MSVFAQDEKKEEKMTYMHDVDEAMYRRGHPWAWLLSASVLFFVAVFFLWANGAMIDDVTRGQGRIIPAQGVQPIQSESGGAITDIMVAENDAVQRNQPLVSISNVMAVAGFRDLQTRSTELTFTLRRLTAEDQGEELVFTEQERNDSPEAVDAQMRLFTTRKEQYTGQAQLLEAQITQRRQDVAEARERRDSSERQLELQRVQEETYRKYAASGSVTRIQYIEVQQRVVALEGELNGAIQSMARAESGVHAAEERLGNLTAERRASIADEINKTRTELNAVEQQILASGEKVTRTELRSPVEGTVIRVLLKRGSVAKPAETILEILPTEGSLEVEARFSPQDRGFLFVNQEAMVKVTAFDFSIYGGLEATISQISSDTIEDKRGDPWFEVRFVTNRNYILYRGEEKPILPGMTVTVDVLTDKRSVLSMIIGPIRRAMQNAMTER
jgi:adhesin transport system membrane fusion protein